MNFGGNGSFVHEQRVEIIPVLRRLRGNVRHYMSNHPECFLVASSVNRLKLDLDTRERLMNVQLELVAKLITQFGSGQYWHQTARFWKKNLEALFRAASPLIHIHQTKRENLQFDGAG